MITEKNYMLVSLERAIGIIEAQTRSGSLSSTEKGRFFTVVFIKRTDNTIRRMNCRTGVKKHLKGVGSSYSFEEHILVSVWTNEARGNKDTGYRSVPKENIIAITIGGETYVVEGRENLYARAGSSLQ